MQKIKHFYREVNYVHLALIHVRFSDDISVCLQILNLEFANAIYALICVFVSKTATSCRYSPEPVLDVNNMYLLFKKKYV